MVLLASTPPQNFHGSYGNQLTDSTERPSEVITEVENDAGEEIAATTAQDAKSSATDSNIMEHSQVNSNNEAVAETAAATGLMDVTGAQLDLSKAEQSYFNSSISHSVPTIPHPISLNVGGCYFHLSGQTLSKSVMLNRIFQEQNDKQNFFIDRDPKLFTLIVQYLRNGEVDVNQLTDTDLKDIGNFSFPFLSSTGQNFHGSQRSFSVTDPSESVITLALLKKEFFFFGIKWPEQCFRCGWLFNREMNQLGSVCCFYHPGRLINMNTTESTQQTLCYQCCYQKSNVPGCQQASHAALPHELENSTRFHSLDNNKVNNEGNQEKNNREEDKHNGEPGNLRTSADKRAELAYLENTSRCPRQEDKEEYLSSTASLSTAYPSSSHSVDDGFRQRSNSTQSYNSAPLFFFHNFPMATCCTRKPSIWRVAPEEGLQVPLVLESSGVATQLESGKLEIHPDGNKGDNVRFISARPRCVDKKFLKNLMAANNFSPASNEQKALVSNEGSNAIATTSEENNTQEPLLKVSENNTPTLSCKEGSSTDLEGSNIEDDRQKYLTDNSSTANPAQRVNRSAAPIDGAQKIRYKTKMCPMLKVGMCSKDSTSCKYAHSLEDLRPTEEYYKTQLCAFWLAGNCKAGLACRHAHGEREIRYRGKLNQTENGNSSEYKIVWLKVENELYSSQVNKATTDSQV